MKIQAFCFLILAILLISFISASNAQKRKKNYYEILEVEKDSSAKEIKKSYFKLAMKYHPDKNPDAPDKSALDLHFSAISHAYQVLSNTATREKYDLRLKQGMKEYTTADMKADEEKAEQEEMTQQWRDSFELFEEEERLSAEEEAQQRKEKAVLIAMGIGMLGMSIWYISKSKKAKKALGVSESTSNANTSKSIQLAIRQDHERTMTEIDKLKEKEEKEKAHAEKIFETVQKRRQALAEEEAARIEAEKAERENQRAHAEARRKALEEAKDGSSANVGDDSEDEFRASSSSDHAIAMETESLLDEDQRVKEKAAKNAAFHCKPCKKSFKSEEQLENHISSKKHKQAVKDAEKASRKKGSASTAASDVSEAPEADE